MFLGYTNRYTLNAQLLRYYTLTIVKKANMAIKKLEQHLENVYILVTKFQDGMFIKKRC